MDQAINGLYASTITGNFPKNSESNDAAEVNDASSEFLEKGEFRYNLLRKVRQKRAEEHMAQLSAVTNRESYSSLNVLDIKRRLIESNAVVKTVYLTIVEKNDFSLKSREAQLNMKSDEEIKDFMKEVTACSVRNESEKNLKPSEQQNNELSNKKRWQMETRKAPLLEPKIKDRTAILTAASATYIEIHALTTKKSDIPVRDNENRVLKDLPAKTNNAHRMSIIEENSVMEEIEAENSEKACISVSNMTQSKGLKSNDAITSMSEVKRTSEQLRVNDSEEGVIDKIQGEEQQVSSDVEVFRNKHWYDCIRSCFPKTKRYSLER